MTPTRSEYQDSLKRPFINNELYNGLRGLVEYIFPAFITLYFALAQTWGWSNVAETMASLTAVNTFMGVLVVVARKRYDNSTAKYDGAFVVDERAEAKDVVTLAIDTPPEQLLNQKDATFRVVKEKE